MEGAGSRKAAKFRCGLATQLPEKTLSDMATEDLSNKSQEFVLVAFAIPGTLGYILAFGFNDIGLM